MDLELIHFEKFCANLWCWARYVIEWVIPIGLTSIAAKYDILSFMPTSPSGTEGVHLTVSAFRGVAITSDKKGEGAIKIWIKYMQIYSSCFKLYHQRSHGHHSPIKRLWISCYRPKVPGQAAVVRKVVRTEVVVFHHNYLKETLHTKLVFWQL